MKNMITFKQIKKEFLSNPENKKEYDRLAPEFAAIKKMIQKRIAKEMTQKALAKKIKTKQSAISRFESGKSNPTVGFLRKVAKGLDAKVKITIS
ncbi:MAG: helix-turn-helix transcriptional regulator [Candidatus Uhrbacteria bacterium]